MTDERKSTATAAGYHFLNMYQNCPWKWHLRHNLHLVPEKTSKYLLFGQAFHAVKERFYKCGGLLLDEMVTDGFDELERLHDQYEHEEIYNEDIRRMEAYVKVWHETFAAREFETYDILAIEEQADILLPGGFTMTVRPDVVVREKATGQVFAFETKTTTRSVSEMARSVACQKQVDAQIMGMQTLFPKETVVGVVPDICYQRQSVRKAERTPIIGRSRKELADSKLMFSGLFAEIGQKVNALRMDLAPPDRMGYPAEMLFARNGSWCGAFGCEYESICTSRFTSAPPGFRLEE